ncbi:hypothetical protein ACFE33_03690 [Falsihalocynthiibacter sp. SS001]|uniref:hypothetical protein n=1 Tax=Falsihalocynthiibacter sp. SS001 TaxID=3349698 RepID=UPI0036D38F00
MKQINSTLLATVLVGVTIIFSGLSIAKGGLFLGKHEVDVLHFMDILRRLQLGYDIHIEFQTPIGVMAFAPIIWFSNLGYDLGISFVLAQTLLAVLLLPVVWWVGVSRLGPIAAMFFGISILAIVCAIVGGGSENSPSISMHYNRWSWAISLSVLALGVIAPQEERRPRPNLEGLMIGVGMAVLALTKVTYFAGFAIPITVGLILNHNMRALVMAVGAGLAVAALATAILGVEYWSAYLGDLLRVAGSDVRPYPGASMLDLLGAPAFIGISFLAFMSCVVLRQSDQNKEALLLLLCMPGFYFVTYQNFGNDPVWLLFVIIVLMVYRPRNDIRNGLGWKMRSAASGVAIAALAVMVPSYINLVTSPLRHAFVDASEYAPFLPDVSMDIHTADIRGKKVTISSRVFSEELEEFVSPPEDEDIREIAGMVLPDCTLEGGVAAMQHAISAGVSKNVAAQGSSLFVADVIMALWIEAGMLPAIGSAPWYYGGLTGYDNASYLLVPKCPLTAIQRIILDNIAEREGETLSLIEDTELYAFFRIDR